MPDMINVMQPSLGERELAAVREVFESNWIGKGVRTEGFETAFAAHLGVGRRHVTSLNSCTEALFLAMELSGIGPGDEVVLPTVSFVGAANAIGLERCPLGERGIADRGPQVRESAERLPQREECRLGPLRRDASVKFGVADRSEQQVQQHIAICQTGYS